MSEELIHEIDALRIKNPHEHEIKVKTVSSPLRRRILKMTRGEITQQEIKAKLGLDDTRLKLQLDYLVTNSYITLQDGVCRLTLKGWDLGRSF